MQTFCVPTIKRRPRNPKAYPKARASLWLTNNYCTTLRMLLSVHGPPCSHLKCAKSRCNDLYVPNMDPEYQLIAAVVSTLLQKLSKLPIPCWSIKLSSEV